MQVQGLTIALRQRSSWEAVDLGVAMMRRHARPILLSWLLTTGAVFVLLHALLLPLDLAWLAALLFWWLKPLYDRIPIHVLARAVMGEAPGVRDTLRAQWQSGWRPILPWLLWRRLHPMRSMLLAVDLLEGQRGPQRRERVRILGKGEGSTATLLWVIGAHLELMLWASVIVFAMMLVPVEFLSDSLQEMFEAMFEHPPWWMELLNNGLYWLAMAVIEPFYVASGFALYLNRRTQLEAWDIELAFRRLAARLGKAAAAVLVLALLASFPPAAAADTSTTPTCRSGSSRDRPLPPVLLPTPILAAVAAEPIDPPAPPPSPDDTNDDDTDDDTDDAPDADDPDIQKLPVTPLSDLFDEPPGEQDQAFERAVAQALADPDLSPKEQRGQWKWRNQDDDEDAPDNMPAWLGAVGAFIALVIENILWIALAVAVLLLIVNHRRWWPWLIARAAQIRPPTPGAVEEHALPVPLPADLSAAVLALWRGGAPRAALSLFYRAALEALVARIGSPLPPGATEAECLRIARRVHATAFATAFRRIVACWQAAAYAHRLPTEAELLDLLSSWHAAEQPT